MPRTVNQALILKQKLENRCGQAARTAVHDACAWTTAQGEIENWTYPVFPLVQASQEGFDYVPVGFRTIEAALPFSPRT